jgi:hypothetical protein
MLYKRISIHIYIYIQKSTWTKNVFGDTLFTAPNNTIFIILLYIIPTYVVRYCKLTYIIHMLKQFYIYMYCIIKPIYNIIFIQHNIITIIIINNLDSHYKSGNKHLIGFIFQPTTSSHAYSRNRYSYSMSSRKFAVNSSANRSVRSDKDLYDFTHYIRADLG